MFNIYDREVYYRGRRVLVIDPSLHATLRDEVAGALEEYDPDEVRKAHEKELHALETEYDEKVCEVSDERDEALARAEQLQDLLDAIEGGNPVVDLIADAKAETARWIAKYNALLEQINKPRKRKR